MTDQRNAAARNVGSARIEVVNRLVNCLSDLIAIN